MTVSDIVSDITLILILLVLVSIRELIATRMTKIIDYTWRGRLYRLWRRIRGG